MNEVLGVEVGITRGKEVVDEVNKRAEEMEKSGELDKKKLEMRENLGLNKEISPQKKELINEWKRKEEERRAKLKKFKEEEEKPIVSSAKEGAEEINK